MLKLQYTIILTLGMITLDIILNLVFYQIRCLLVLIDLQLKVQGVTKLSSVSLRAIYCVYVSNFLQRAVEKLQITQNFHKGNYNAVQEKKLKKMESRDGAKKDGG